METVMEEDCEMNERQRTALRKNRVQIVDDLEPRGGVLDCLLEDEILTENDAEEIDSASTRKERCQTLLQILPRRGPDAYGAFTRALEKNSLHHIVERLETVSHGMESRSLSDKTICAEKCSNCSTFLTHVTRNGNSNKADSTFIDTMRTHICDVIENVDPRDIVDSLIQDDVLTENDIEEIRTANPRRKRCEKLVEILLHKDNENKTEALARSMRKKYKFIADAIEKDIDLHKDTEESQIIMRKSMSTIATPGQSKKLALAFNYLSTLVNQGDFTKFTAITSNLKRQHALNYDMMCIIGYLRACRDLFQANFDAAKKEIRTTLELVPKTTNPRYFTLEILTAKIRLYVIQKRIGKLESTQDDAMMLLESDPEGCSGRAAGWLCINHARTMTTRMSCLNLRQSESLHTYDKLFHLAKSSLQRAMTNFKKDGGKDGPFGFGFAITRMIILLMRCGDNGKTIDMLQPCAEDLKTAGRYVGLLEDSDIEMSKILQMHFYLARCDYQFRRHNLTRAREHAQCALTFASECNILEFKENASNRLSFLDIKMSRMQLDHEAEFVKTFMLNDSSDRIESESP